MCGHYTPSLSQSLLGEGETEGGGPSGGPQQEWITSVE